jgi:hypothetical protein
MSDPVKHPCRAQHVVRLSQLSAYTGNKQTINDELVRLGLFKPFSMSPGGRNKVVTEQNIAEVQEAAQEAGNIDALIAKLKAERE